MFIKVQYPGVKSMIFKFFLVLITLITFFSVSCSENTQGNSNLCNPNPCADSQIPHKTICQDLNNDYTCVCEAGYKLKENICIKISNNTPCENNPCTEENKTTCTVIGDSYECSCDVNYHMENNKCVKDSGTPCEDYICSDNFSSCQVDENGDAYCACFTGYIKENGLCRFDCSNIQNSHVNNSNDGCICEHDFHSENNKCLPDTKRVSCQSGNPDKPVNATENNETVDITWNNETNSWNDTPYCSWICNEKYEGDNCDECISDYIMSDGSCIYDCSSDIHSKPNQENNDCECIEDYHMGTDGFCTETVNPCQNNPCLNAGVTSGKTKCVANSQEAGDYTCTCEDGFEENEDNICIQLSEIHIRAVAGNISTGNYQSYDPGEGIRIFQGLKGDIMMVQEFNYKDNSENDYKEFVETVFQDPECFENNRCFYEVGTGAVIPNGVVSRFPVLDWGELPDPAGGVDTTRHLNWAILDIPGNKDLFVVSVHLRTSPGSDQVREAEVVVNYIQSVKEEAHYLGYYFMVGGDFNGPTSACDNDTTDGWGLYNTFNVCDPFPVGEDGDSDTSANRSKHNDWLLVSADLSAFQVSTDYCAESNSNDCKRYPHGLVMDTRDFTQSELDTYFSPTGFDNKTLSVDDSSGNSMQHMAIIKDFVIRFGD